MAKVDEGMADEVEQDLQDAAGTAKDIMDKTGLNDKIKDKIKDAFSKDKSEDSSGDKGESDPDSDRQNQSSNGENDSNNIDNNDSGNSNNNVDKNDSNNLNNDNNSNDSQNSNVNEGDKKTPNQQEGQNNATDSTKTNNDSKTPDDKKKAKDKNNKKGNNNDSRGVAQAGDDLKKDSSKSIAEKAADSKLAKGAGKGMKEAGKEIGKESVKKGVEEAGKKVAAETGKQAALAAAKAGVSSAAGAAGAAAAGPVGWVVAAAQIINQMTNSTDGLATGGAILIVLLLLPVIVILAGIVLILSAAAILAVLLMNAFSFVFGFLIPDEEESLTENSTPEERYTVIAKIIRKKVKDDYDAMISEWKDDLKAHKNNKDYNEFGLALENSGYDTPNLAKTDEASQKIYIGTGHNNTVADLYDNWAYPQSYYLKMFPRGVKDTDNEYLDGDEPYFDYERSVETMGNESNNGSVSNMKYLVAGYNASRCEMPINESGQSWFARTFKSYYWDITSQTWWNDLLDFIGFDTYFEYSATLSPPQTNIRYFKKYEPCYWENLTVEKEFTWNITVDVEPLNATYGAHTNFITDRTEKVSLVTTNEEDTGVNPIKLYYQDELEDYYGVQQGDLPSSVFLTDSDLLTAKYIAGLNANQYPENEVINKFTNYSIGNSKKISISSIDSTGKANATCSYKTWVSVGQESSYSPKSTASTNTVGSYKYTPIYASAAVAGTNLFGTTVVYESGSTKAITKPTMSNKTTGSDPYYVSIASTVRTEVGEQTTDSTYDATWQTIETIPCEENLGEVSYSTYKGGSFTSDDYDFELSHYEFEDGVYTFYYNKYKRWDEYKVTSYYWDWTKYRYEYKYSKMQYQEKGVKISISVALTPTSKVTETATFNKSTYVDDKAPYTYRYLKASSQSFKNSYFVEVMLEKDNSYYDSLPKKVNIPAYIDADGKQISPQYNVSMEDALAKGYIDVIPNSTDYDGGKNGGIADWPYLGNVNGYEYECGAIGTKITCTSRPPSDISPDDEEYDNYDPYNNDEDGESCGCGDAAKQDNMGSVGENAAVNTTIRSTLCTVIVPTEVVTDDNGEPKLDENGHKQYVGKVKIKTVQDRIEELVADFENIIDGVDAEENVSELGIVSTNYGNVSDLTIFTIDTFDAAFDTITYSGSGGWCGDTWALGKIGLHGDMARTLLQKIYEADPDRVRQYWAETDEYAAGDHVDDPFYINDSNHWNSSKDHVTCDCKGLSASFRVYLCDVLYSTTAQDVQAKLAGQTIQNYINSINSTYGVTDPGALTWLTILCNKCGWDNFKANYGTVVTQGMSNGGTLFDIYATYLSQKGGDDDDWYYDMSSYYADIRANSDKLPETWNQKTTIAYGSIALPNETDVVYYNQATGWQKYGELDTTYYGSGPLICAILGSTLVDKALYDPDYCINYAYTNGYYDEVYGSKHNLIEGFCDSVGLFYEYAETSADVANALSNGDLVVVLMQSTGSNTDYYKSSTPHFVVLRGITEDDKILVADPGSLNNSENQEGFDLASIWNNRIQDGCTNGHVWIISD